MKTAATRQSGGRRALYWVPYGLRRGAQASQALPCQLLHLRCEPLERRGPHWAAKPAWVDSRPVEQHKHGSPRPGWCSTIQYMRQQPLLNERACS